MSRVDTQFTFTARFQFHFQNFQVRIFYCKKFILNVDQIINAIDAIPTVVLAVPPLIGYDKVRNYLLPPVS
jgi:hypothetical protein